MNKKILKIGMIVLLTIFMISFIVANSYALSPSDITAEQTVTGASDIESLGQKIVGILQTVGVVLSVVVLIVLGIKYMMGSAEEKAEYKKTMIPYIVGAALIFAASVFANVIYQFFSGI